MHLPCTPPPNSVSPPTTPLARSVVILPGLGNSAGDYGDLADALRRQGAHVEVVQVSRIDWSRNAAALTDANWWKGTLQPRPAVDWWVHAVVAIPVHTYQTGGQKQ